MRQIVPGAFNFDPYAAGTCGTHILHISDLPSGYD